MQKLIINIHTLYGILDNQTKVLKGNNLDKVNALDNAWLLIEDDKIADFGGMQQLPQLPNIVTIDAEGKDVLPAFVDSHTHLVYAANREKEFEDRLNGLSYQEIANRGGGILNSVKTLRSMSEDQLFQDAHLRLKKIIGYGTGAIEIKSGYGLDVENELKMLRVIKRLKEVSPVPIKANFLGAHAFPNEYKTNPEGYMALIIDKMLPIIEQEKLADYMDVFCEVGYFDVDQTDRLLAAGLAHGLKPKIHVNQFNAIGGIEVALKHKAISVDHLEVLAQKDIALLAQANCMATALPGCSFFLGIPYTPLQALIDQGVAVNLASDYNPGSTPCGNLQFIMSLACIQQKITPNQAFNAVTINAAAALEMADKVGSITKGKLANLIIANHANGLAYWPYAYGENKVGKMIVKGETIK